LDKSPKIFGEMKPTLCGESALSFEEMWTCGGSWTTIRHYITAHVFKLPTKFPYTASRIKNDYIDTISIWNVPDMSESINMEAVECR